jgi:hypothetical protein
MMGARHGDVPAKSGSRLAGVPALVEEDGLSRAAAGRIEDWRRPELLSCFYQGDVPCSIVKKSAPVTSPS